MSSSQRKLPIGFDVGSSDDFAKEVEATIKNKKLVNHLAAGRDSGKRVPLGEVKRRLRLR